MHTQAIRREEGKRTRERHGERGVRVSKGREGSGEGGPRGLRTWRRRKQEQSTRRREGTSVVRRTVGRLEREGEKERSADMGQGREKRIASRERGTAEEKKRGKTC